MGTRSGSSSSRSSGGTNAATGYPLDTLVVIGGDGKKEIRSISWSYGANGGGIPSVQLPLFGRLVVVAADLTALIPANGTAAVTGIINHMPADYSPGGLYNSGGRVLFDNDLMLDAGGGTQNQFIFPVDTNEGWIGVDSGPISIMLYAPVMSTGLPPVDVVGKLTVQYANVYGTNAADGTPGYGYPRISRSAL